MPLAKYQPIFTRARWILLTYFHFSVFQDMCCKILCSNGVLDATCHKHIFYCDSLSHFLCSTCITQGFGNFLALHVSFCNNYNSVQLTDHTCVLFYIFFFCTSVFSFFFLSFVPFWRTPRSGLRALLGNPLNIESKNWYRLHNSVAIEIDWNDKCIFRFLVFQLMECVMRKMGNFGKN